MSADMESRFTQNTWKHVVGACAIRKESYPNFQTLKQSNKCNWVHEWGRESIHELLPSHHTQNLLWQQSLLLLTFHSSLSLIFICCLRLVSTIVVVVWVSCIDVWLTIINLRLFLCCCIRLYITTRLLLRHLLSTWYLWSSRLLLSLPCFTSSFSDSVSLQQIIIETSYFLLFFNRLRLGRITRCILSGCSSSSSSCSTALFLLCRSHSLGYNIGNRRRLLLLLSGRLAHRLLHLAWLNALTNTLLRTSNLSIWVWIWVDFRWSRTLLSMNAFQNLEPVLTQNLSLHLWFNLRESRGAWDNFVKALTS